MSMSEHIHGNGERLVRTSGRVQGPGCAETLVAKKREMRRAQTPPVPFRRHALSRRAGTGLVPGRPSMCEVKRSLRMRRKVGTHGRSPSPVLKTTVQFHQQR